MDIILKTLDFSDKYTLPPSSKETGYVSISGTIEHCGTGSFEFVFRDDELEAFVAAHPEGLFLKWGHFEGYVSDYQFLENKKTLYGSHLNYLANRIVFPKQNITGETVEETVKDLITTNAPWLVFDDTGYTEAVEFSTDKYMSGDAFLKEYLGKLKWGYKIYLENETIHFKLVKPVMNSLMFSVGNRNIYEISEDFNNKDAAYGGWYKKTEENDGTKLENEKWLYITSEKKTGIYKKDIVLSAHSPRAAADELAAKKNKHIHLAKTRNVEFTKDYSLGDIIRLKTTQTTKKQVQSIDLWSENNTYHEEPVFAEWEE